MAERPRFPITQEDIADTLRISGDYKKMDQDEKGIAQMMKDENPHLYNFICDNARSRQYGRLYKHAAFWTYEYVTACLESTGEVVTLTESDILLHRQNVQDAFVSIKTHRTKWDPDKPPEDTMFSSFINVLADAAPALLDHLKEQCSKTQDILQRRFYLKGVFDGFMPFYSRLNRSEYNYLWNSPPHHLIPQQELLDEPDTLSADELERLWTTPPRGVPFEESADYPDADY